MSGPLGGIFLSYTVYVKFTNRPTMVICLHVAPTFAMIHFHVTNWQIQHNRLRLWEMTLMTCQSMET